jgi:GTP pyrophosphokinase
MTVSSYVLEFGGSIDQAIAGLLHDAIEDQGDRTSYEEISNRFGESVCEIVRACTDAETTPKPPWAERKRAYLEKLASKPDHIKLVVACDKLHNAESIVRDVRLHGAQVWDRFNASPAQILWYYQGIVKALGVFDSPVVRLLGAKVEEMRELVVKVE